MLILHNGKHAVNQGGTKKIPREYHAQYIKRVIFNLYFYHHRENESKDKDIHWRQALHENNTQAVEKPRQVVFILFLTISFMLFLDKIALNF